MLVGCRGSHFCSHKSENLVSENEVPGISPIILEMHDQSDRGAAICGAVFLENKLEAAIVDQWPDMSNRVHVRLFSGGPLSSFSAKISLAHAMGVVCTEVKSDMDKIRKIRNSAAHAGVPFSFSSLATGQILNELQCLQGMPLDEDEKSLERNQFTSAVKFLAMYLFFQKEWKKKFGHLEVMPLAPGTAAKLLVSEGDN